MGFAIVGFQAMNQHCPAEDSVDEQLKHPHLMPLLTDLHLNPAAIIYRFDHAYSSFPMTF